VHGGKKQGAQGAASNKELLFATARKGKGLSKREPSSRGRAHLISDEMRYEEIGEKESGRGNAPWQRTTLQKFKFRIGVQ